jgi:hypothetical protein
MSRHITCAVFSVTFAWSIVAQADDKPYLTTKSEITLLSTNDGETDPAWRTTVDGLTDYEVKTKDSFTVIRLGPDHPPVCKTIYGTVPCSILGTPSMAMSSDGHYGLITNHGGRLDGLWPLKYPPGEPLTNADLNKVDLMRQDLAPPRSNMLSLVDLASPEFPVVDRVLFDDYPMLVQAHPDRCHFVVGATKYFYVYRIDEGKLVEVSRSLHDKGYPEFGITPTGDRLITTQGDWTIPGQFPVVRWYSVSPGDISYLGDVRVSAGVDTQLTPDSYILRVSPDGSRALITQDSMGMKGSLCDVLVADLTKSPPVIDRVIKQVGDGVESFAFHPNGKMAVATCLSKFNNSIVILDIESDPPRILYNLDAGGCGQGIEFTPEGDKLFVGSAIANRIEVFDVLSDFELRKNPKFLKTGHGHCSLTLGPTYKE